MSTLLGQHTDAVHKGSTHPTTNQHVKLEKLPRPVFSLNMSESQWNFTILQWNAYIQQTETDDNVKLMQLQAACDDQLRQRVFDTGVYSTLTTPDLFLQQMKELQGVPEKIIRSNFQWQMHNNAIFLNPRVFLKPW